MEKSRKRPIDAKTALEIDRTQTSLQSRNPFKSPNLSTSYVNETDDGSTSGQSEFHLERYSSNAKYKHLRQVSKASTSASDREKKPDLSIVTDFTDPNVHMRSTSVTINEVPAKRAKPGRNWTMSIVSQKGIRATTTPDSKEKHDFQTSDPRSRRRQASIKGSKKNRYVQQFQNVVKQQVQNNSSMFQTSTRNNVQKRDAETSPDQNVTPMTPAIVVTPAGEQVPWVLQVKGGDHPRRPASSIYSAMPTSRIPTIPHFDAPPVPVVNDHRVYLNVGERGLSPGNSELNESETSDSTRPQSQGWWNVMLSPLLRNASQASKKSRRVEETPPVPPLPFSAITKQSSSAISSQSSPSILVSGLDTSPETPRRAGLASAHASTWSRWTEWEEEREANNRRSLDAHDEGEFAQDWEENDDTQLILAPAPPPAVVPVSTKPGLAAEYFHACAVEQLTGAPYFECINHSCAEQLPKFHAIYDNIVQKPTMLGSPFGESRGLKSQLVPPQESLGRLSIDKEKESQSPLSPNELSPNVREASIAAVVRAKSLESLSGKKKIEVTNNDSETKTNATKEHISSPSASTKEIIKSNPSTIFESESMNEPSDIACVKPCKNAAISKSDSSEKFDSPPELEPVSEKSKEIACSPGPISPEGHKTLHPMNGLLMSDMSYQHGIHGPPVIVNNYTNPNPLPERPAFITAETSYPELPQRAPIAAVTAEDLEPPKRFDLKIENRRRRHEKEDATAKKVGGLWRDRGCFSSSNCMGRGGPENRAKRRWTVIISILLLVVIVVSISLAVTLTRHDDSTPVNGQWLNLTGFPSMPIGVLTIATPNLVYQQSQCMVVPTMWSCSVPKEDQNQLNGNNANQPNLRFEIKFRNGTVPANMTIPLAGNNTKSPQSTASDPFTNDLYIPNPSPPNTADQIFLGNTTDNITAPFDGEQTPFYLTLMPTFPIVPPAFNSSTSPNEKSARFTRRQASNSSLTAGDPSVIPAPALTSDGTAAPANLFPTLAYPANQPVRLYNRGLPDEHYGFYIYYDKSIYLSALVLNGTTYTGPPVQAVDADQNGGSTKALANARCTFSQTRYLVKFYTNPAFNGNLLATPFPLGSGYETSGNPKNNNKNQTLSSATDFNRPGSFPYPASVVLDRHGGDIDSKGVYCYGMENGQIVKENRIVLGENINFGGVVVNHPNFDGFNKTAGGIDGGTGGCGCQWQNWQ